MLNRDSYQILKLKLFWKILALILREILIAENRVKIFS